jgi:Family of unknown function (DUF6311)
MEQMMQANRGSGLAFVIVISATFFYFTFGIDFLQGTSSFWQRQGSDTAQYISGFNVFFKAPWGLPLLAFDGINYPVGTRVTFVDAIPLYALLLKLLVPSSWAPFNPFGVWVGLCFILQGVGAWWILKELKINSWVALVMLLALLLTYPALMRRLGHISLMSQWIILFSFALYFRGRHSAKFEILGWTLLLLVGFYINLYLTVMATGIMVASVLSAKYKITIRQVIYYAVPFLFIAGTLFLTVLPLPVAEVSRESGFGFYSMNLLSPFMGGDLMSVKAGQGDGQYEGFNYLGLGVLGGLIYLFVKKRDLVWAKIKSNKQLFIVLVLYTVYALSDHIYFGQNEILVLKYPKFMEIVTSQLRVSGRFFWPVGYCLIILLVSAFYHFQKTRNYFLAMALIVGVQLLDVSNVYRAMSSKAHKQTEQHMDHALWRNHIGSRAEVVYFYPKFKCGAKPMQTLLPVMHFAAMNELKINTGYIARYTPSCADIKEEIENSDKLKSVYVFSREEYPDEEKILPLFSDPASVKCEVVQFAYVCQAKSE